MAAVPVLERVAAIFRQTMPDLPMPVRIDAALAVAEEMDGADESLIEPIDQREDRRGLGVQDFAGQ